MLYRIVIPGALPSIIAGIQLALIFAWLGTIGAEYLMGGVARGIGAFVMAGSEQLRPEVMILGIIVIAVAGMIINNLFRTTRQLLPWQDTA